MSSYTKSTDFASKDALLTGNPLKVVKGTEIDDEFNAIQTAVNSKADINSPDLTGTPTAPTAAAGTNTTQIATTAFVLTNGVPVGAILMWSGSVASIPSGFALCDGTNSTPDLRNRFIVGAGNTYAVDATGGSADAVVVSHSHTTSTASLTGSVSGISETFATNGGSASGVFSKTSTGPTLAGTPDSPDTSPSGTFAIDASHSHTVNSTGESGTNKNLPPYYALAYIMKL